jgi:hypothetical protein
MKWRTWLRECSRDPKSRAVVPKGSLGMLTGQDAHALDAIVGCWQLYACGDDAGQRGALAAVRALLPTMQPKCRFFARELIAFVLDWDDRARLWPLVYQGNNDPGKCWRDDCAKPPIEHSDFCAAHQD